MNALAAPVRTLAEDETGWLAPVEMCVLLTSAPIAKILRERRGRGLRAKPTASVFRRKSKLYAIVQFYGAPSRDILFCLNLVVLWENCGGPRPR